MGLEDRDWYREAYKEKEEKYGPDFSAKGGPKSKKTADKSPHENASKRTQNPSGNPNSQSAKANRTSGQQNIHGNVFSEKGNYGSIRFGPDVSAPSVMNAPGICPKCNHLFLVRVKKQKLYKYDYACPECGHVVKVRSTKDKSFIGMLAMVLEYVLGIALLIIVVGYAGNYLHDNVFPIIVRWFLETFGAYI